MFVYVFLLVLTIAGFFLLQKAKPQVKDVLYWIICIIIFLVVALRADNMGGDTESYRYSFLHPKSQVNYTEPGLLYFNAILRFFTTDVVIASIIKAFLCLMPIFMLLRRFSSNIFASLFLFITFSWEGSTFLLEMSAERQCFAMSLFCIFLCLYIKNNQRYSFCSILCLVLMVLFHYSSVLVVLLLILDKIHLKRWVLMISCIVATLSLYYIGDYLDPMIQLAEVMDKGNYLSAFGENEESLISLIPFVGSFLIPLNYLPEEQLNTIWFKGFFLSTILTAFVMPMGINISRMSAYFYFGTFISLPWTFDYINNRVIRYGFILVLFGYFTSRYLTVLDIMTEVENGMVPYQTLFK